MDLAQQSFLGGEKKSTLMPFILGREQELKHMIVTSRWRFQWEKSCPFAKEYGENLFGIITSSDSTSTQYNRCPNSSLHDSNILRGGKKLSTGAALLPLHPREHTRSQTYDSASLEDNGFMEKNHIPLQQREFAREGTSFIVGGS